MGAADMMPVAGAHAWMGIVADGWTAARGKGVLIGGGGVRNWQESGI
jgi:hypothetical protein